MADLVAVWSVVFKDGKHQIEFEHGTTTGKRVIRVDGKEVLRKDWVFKLVGTEYFKIGRTNCCVTIGTGESFTYQYSLEVDGKPLDKYIERQSKILQMWEWTTADNREIRVALEKDSLEIYVNGQCVPTTGEFVDDGVETHFMIFEFPAYIKAINSGKRKSGIIHKLFISNTEIMPNT